MANATANGHTNHTKTYMIIFGALAVLTAIEVGITYIPMPKVAMIIILIAFALFKAGLVAVYFMHLKYDAKFLKIIAYSPLAVASILILMISLEWAFQPHWLF